MKNVVQFNIEIREIILDSYEISFVKKYDNFTSGLNLYVWREMFIQDHDTLMEAIVNAQRIEASHRRARASKTIKTKKSNS